MSQKFILVWIMRKHKTRIHYGHYACTVRFIFSNLKSACVFTVGASAVLQQQDHL